MDTQLMERVELILPDLHRMAGLVEMELMFHCKVGRPFLMPVVGVVVDTIQAWVAQEVADWVEMELAAQLAPQTPVAEVEALSTEMAVLVDRVSWSCVTKEPKPQETTE